MSENIQSVLKNFKLNDGLVAAKILSENIASTSQLDLLGRNIKGYMPAATYEKALQGVPHGKVRIFDYVTSDEAKAGIHGHFVTIDNRNPDYIQYADPYGINPDDGRSYLSLPPHKFFSECLNKAKKRIRINHVQFQDLTQLDDSCGIWALMFAKNPDLNSSEYKRHVPNSYYDFNLEFAFVDDLDKNMGRKPQYVGHLKQLEKII